MRVAVRVTPKARQTRIDGAETGGDEKSYLKVRVTAPPEKGKANQAMIKLLAKAWRVPRGQLTIVAGTKERNKTLLLRGDNPDNLMKLHRWAAAVTQI